MGHHRYGIALDAGSSGTRAHLYKWDDIEHAREEASPKEALRLPKIKSKKEWVKKVRPGVSTFADKPDQIGAYLQPLFDHVSVYIPDDQISQTPLFLLATAGLRMVDESKRRVLLDKICAYAKTNTKFLLPDCNVQIAMISGETEGLYGWIALNYLLGGFDYPEKHNHGKGHHTYGFLDMGGASSQIAFAPNATESEKHPESLQLLRLRRINGDVMEFSVFVNTWLGYGVNEARKAYVKKLLDGLKDTAAAEKQAIEDPCLPKGLVTTLDGTEIQDGIISPEYKDKHLTGTGKLDECLKSVYPLLETKGPCLSSPCLLTDPNVPKIDFDVNHFLGISEYWHTTHEIFEINSKKKAYDFATYQKRVSEFCSMDWNVIEKSVNGMKWGKNVDERRAMETCFKASWLINVLHDGIGIPRVGIEGSFGDSDDSDSDTDDEDDGHKKEKKKKPDEKGRTGFLGAFKPINKVDDVEVSWTLGRIILYATALIPPLTTKDRPTALPVGFGPKIAAAKSSTPAEFQYGWNYAIPPSPSDSSLKSNVSGHPITALFFLFVILLLALFLTGRGNRFLRRGKDLLHALRGNRGKKRWVSGSDGGLVSYERAAEFELDDMDSEEEIEGRRTPNRDARLYVDTGVGGSLSRRESTEALVAGSSVELAGGISRARSPRPR